MSLSCYPHRLLLFTAFLTDRVVFEALVGRRQGRGAAREQFLESFDRPLRQAFHALAHELPERQRQLILEEELRKADLQGKDRYVSFLINALEGLGTCFFRLRHSGAAMDPAMVVPWLEFFGSRLPSTPLLAALLSSQTGAGRPGSQDIDRLFSRGVVPTPDCVDTQALIKEGLADNHVHFSNLTHPTIIWCHLLQQPLRVAHAYGRKKERDSEYDLWDLVLPQLGLAEFYAWLKFAARLRDHLVYFLTPEGKPAQYKVSSNLLKVAAAIVAGDSDAVDGLGLYFDPLSHPGAELPGGRAGNPVVSEGAFWLRSLQHLKANPDDIRFAQLLHLYLLLECLTMRITAHQFHLRGFDLFERYATAEMRDKLESNGLAKERLIQMQRTGEIENLEARVSGKPDLAGMRRRVWPVVGNYQQLWKDKKVDYTLGVGVHFIKREDKDRRKLAKEGLAVIRHRRERDSLVRQMTALMNYRHCWREVCVVDAANSEFHARPEVFAPIFREIRRRFDLGAWRDDQWEPDTPLHFTFHVGEEFHHLSSGLRAIDEALEFLNLPDGSRLGHGFALGFSPELFDERVPGALAPKEEWLDNLVWLYGRLPHLSTFRAWARARISELSSEIYGAPEEPEVLFEAWRLRELGVTPMELTLRSQEERYGFFGVTMEPAGTEPKKVRLWRKHHRDLEVAKKGVELTTLRTSTTSDKEWAEIQRAMKEAQLYLLREIDRRRIALEVCLTSNLRITQTYELREHPLFNWQKGNHPPRVTLCTDNPGMLQTSLPLELCAAMQTYRKLNPSEPIEAVLEWGRRVAEVGRRVAFVPPPPSQPDNAPQTFP